MQTIVTTEGEAKIEVPDPSLFRTKSGDYAPSLTEVFYNPVMEFCRDISVSAAQVIADKLKDVMACDPLAGVGVRAIRYSKEVRGVSRVLANDRSPKAYELMKRNISMNGVSDKVEPLSLDANVLLRQNKGRFQLLDIDPYGSPAPFLDAACSALARRGMLALTATDTGPLSGTHPRACLRRYGSKPLKTEYCHELGIRILIAFAQRVAGKYEVGLSPLLAHATMHYFRIYLEARGGPARADEMLAGQGYLSHCFACGDRILTTGPVPHPPEKCDCGGGFSHAGPLWLGSLMDRGFLEQVTSDLNARNFKSGYKELMLLNRCHEESQGPPTFYDLNELSRLAGVQSPKISEAVSALRDAGYFASRTHFSDNGVRTDASNGAVKEILRQMT